MRRLLASSGIRFLLAIGAACFATNRHQEIQATEIDGFAEPYREIDVAAAELGKLASVEVSEGDTVVAGQILASLDDEVLRASLEIARSNVESQGQLNAARAELNLLETRLNKLAGLLDRHHASPVEVERTRMQMEVAKAQVQAVEEQLQTKAMECRRIEAQLEQRRVRSPISGIVTKVLRDAGEFVSGNEPTVARVVQLDPLLVVFSVPKELASMIHKDDTMKVEFPLCDETVNGVVEFVSPTADAQSGTTRVKIRVPNSDHKLLSGDACRLILSQHLESLVKK